MVLKIYGDIDLQKENSLVGARFENLASAPASPATGQEYFNTTNSTKYIWDGTQWLDALSQGTANAVTRAVVAGAAGELFVSAGADRTSDTYSGAAGIIKVDASGIASTATVGTDYLTADSTNTLTNKTFDANGTGNSLSNVEIADFATAALTSDLSTSALATQLVTADEVKAYADGLLAANDAMIFQGGLDASGVNQLPAGDAGDTYKITVAGDFNGTTNTMDVGNTVICTVDTTAANTPANWVFLQTDLDYATETSSGFVEIATQTETNTGTDDTRVITPLKLATYVAANTTGKYAQAITTVASVALTVTHSLNSTDVIVQVRDAAGDVVDVEIDNFTANTVDVTTRPAITGGRIIVIG